MSIQPFETVKQLGYGFSVPSTVKVEDILNVEVLQNLDTRWADGSYEDWVKSKYDVTTKLEMIESNEDALMAFLMYPPASPGTLLFGVELSTVIRWYTPEGEDRAYFMVTPPSLASEWVRETNTLDWEMHQLKRSEDAHVTGSQFLTYAYNHFPLSGYTNLTDGEDIHPGIMQVVRAMTNWSPKYAKMSAEKYKGNLHMLKNVCSTKLGFEISEPGEVWNHIMPKISGEVRDLLEWLQLFKNEESVNDLRPALMFHSESK